MFARIFENQMISRHLDWKVFKNCYITYTLSAKRYTHFKTKIFKICMLLIILFKCEDLQQKGTVSVN